MARPARLVGCGHTLPIRRFISRNSASAASPRRLCSSGVVSGTSLCHDRGFRAVTIADLLIIVGWGCDQRPMFALWLTALDPLSPVGSVAEQPPLCGCFPQPPPAHRLSTVLGGGFFFAVTTAAPVISASVRPFRFGGGL